MRAFVTLATTLLVGFILGGCGLFEGESTDLGEPVPFEPVDRAYGLEVNAAQTYVFRDSSTWARFWNEHVDLYDANAQPYPPPHVDFDRRMIIALFWGMRIGTNPVDTVSAIEGIYDQSDRMNVRVGPLPDLGPGRLVLHPTQVVHLPRTEKPVVFSGEIPEQ